MLSWRQIFNLANGFLIILVGLVLWNCFLSIQALKSEQNSTTTSNIYFRVIDSKKSFFGQTIYTVWAENGFWLMEGKGSFRLGYEYEGEGKLSEFGISDEDKKNYDLSLGLLGKIKLSKTLKSNLNCDWLCQGIVLNANFKQNLQNNYKKILCSDFKFVPDIIAQNSQCQDVFGLTVGLVLGGSGEFTDIAKQNFKTLGLTHLIAVSGFQVGLLAGFIEAITNKVGAGRKLKITLIILAICVLMVIVGPQPPVLRSGISVGLSLLVLNILGRGVEQFRLLIYSALIMLLINPFYILSVSFQLSFAASLGLVFGLKVENLAQVKVWNIFQEGLVSSTVAFLFTLPIIIHLSGYVSLMGIITNTLIVPFISVITIFNLLGAIPFVGGIFMFPASVMQSLIMFLVNDLGKLSGVFKLSEFGFVEGLIYYASLILFFKLFSLIKNKKNLNATTQKV
ncbi:MAG: ComEC/Rec2 family competence protein [bacterium]